eukprot:gene17549-biopygen9849
MRLLLVVLQILEQGAVRAAQLLRQGVAALTFHNVLCKDRDDARAAPVAARAWHRFGLVAGKAWKRRRPSIASALGGGAFIGHDAQAAPLSVPGRLAMMLVRRPCLFPAGRP